MSKVTMPETKASNVGDVLTVINPDGQQVAFRTPTGIGGIAAQNAGVAVPGTFTTLDALGGTLADLGGGVLTYTPPAASNAWTTLHKAADQSTALTVLQSDTDLTFPVVAGTSYRVRARIHLENTGGGSFGVNVTLAGPAMTVYREQAYWQAPGTNGIPSPNIATAPQVINSGNLGAGAIEYWVIFTPSANGTVVFKFDQQAGGVGVTTIRAGSFLEYGVA